MGETMIERVARAIDAAEMKWKAENGGDSASCIDCPDIIKARAAIEAMRDPTVAMIEAGAKEQFYKVNLYCWRAMIDAALAEEKP